MWKRLVGDRRQPGELAAAVHAHRLAGRQAALPLSTKPNWRLRRSLRNRLPGGGGVVDVNLALKNGDFFAARAVDPQAELRAQVNDLSLRRDDGKAVRILVHVGSNLSQKGPCLERSQDADVGGAFDDHLCAHVEVDLGAARNQLDVLPGNQAIVRRQLDSRLRPADVRQAAQAGHAANNGFRGRRILCCFRRVGSIGRNQQFPLWALLLRRPVRSINKQQHGGRERQSDAR